MTEQPVLDVPREREIRDELQRLVLADLHGPLGGDDEEFSGENPIDRYPLGRLAPRGEVLEPDDQDELPAAETGDAGEPDPEPSAPNVPSLNPSSLGFTAHVDGQASELRVTAKWARYEFTASEREETLGKRMWRRIQQGGTVPLGLPRGCSHRRHLTPISRTSSCAGAPAGTTGTGWSHCFWRTARASRTANGMHRRGSSRWDCPRRAQTAGRCSSRGRNDPAAETTTTWPSSSGWPWRIGPIPSSR